MEWLLLRHPETPRTRAKQWIQSGRVSVGGVAVRKPQEMMRDPGAGLGLSQRGATTLDCGEGWQVHPRVGLLYLDTSLAIVNKGPGLISVPAEGVTISALSILADFLAGKLRARDRGVAGKTLPAVYRKLEILPVHRLDQFTSGALCMATHPAAREHLIEQLRTHTMERGYVAFCEGRSKSTSGTWRNWLELSADEMRQQIVSASRGETRGSAAQEAITHFKVIGEYVLADGKTVVTKLRLKLETGRKHQIRVQAAHAGLALIGDRAYNPKYRGLQAVAPIAFDRQALHAEVLALQHPASGSRLTWRAPMPKDLRQLEAALGASRI